MRTRIERYHYSELSLEYLELIADLTRRAFAKYKVQSINMRGVTMTGAKLQESLRKGNETIFVLYEEDMPVAYERGRVETDQWGVCRQCIEGLATLPECAGRGYASQLVKACEAWAIQQGAVYACVDTSNRAEATKKFYHSRGYQDWYYRHLKGRSYVSIYMRKDYGAPYPAWRRMLRLWVSHLRVRSQYTEYGQMTVLGRPLDAFRRLRSRLKRKNK